MFSTVFPTGQTFSSSALQPTEMEAIFQLLVLQIFGVTIKPATPPTGGSPAVTEAEAASMVRIGWQPDGQPSFTFGQDYCIITAYTLGREPFGLVRDQLIQSIPNVDSSINQLMAYTQAWRIHFTMYGPNCTKRGQQIVSAIASAGWVHDWLAGGCQGNAVHPIYVVAQYPHPTYAPENFQKRWWPRADLDLKFYELVVETLDSPSAESMSVELITDTGYTQTINVGE